VKGMQCDRMACGLAALPALLGALGMSRAGASTPTDHNSSPVLQSETTDITRFPGFTSHDLAYSGLDGDTSGVSTSCGYPMWP
jgi:hypothetical protein